MTIRNSVALAAAIVISELAGLIGSVFTAPAISTWYATLVRPAIAPPSWVFAPVWTSLFLLMGIAAFLVWKKVPRTRMARVGLLLFGIQLILNTTWSLVFFGLQNPGAALIEIAILWLFILGTIVAFARISKAAAWLLAPYILWVTFAAYLNYLFWSLN